MGKASGGTNRRMLGGGRENASGASATTAAAACPTAAASSAGPPSASAAAAAAARNPEPLVDVSRCRALSAGEVLPSQARAPSSPQQGGSAPSPHLMLPERPHRPSEHRSPSTLRLDASPCCRLRDPGVPRCSGGGFSGVPLGVALPALRGVALR